jgi:hypothetical protein
VADSICINQETSKERGIIMSQVDEILEELKTGTGLAGWNESAKAKLKSLLLSEAVDYTETEFDEPVTVKAIPIESINKLFEETE